eukprot:s5436_g7.t1
MALVRSAASGEILAKLSGNAWKTATTRELKSTLASLWPDVSRFRIRLLRCGRILGEEETPFTETEEAEACIDVVFIAQRPPTRTEVNMLTDALGKGNSMAVEMLLMKGIDTEFFVEYQRHRLVNILTFAVMKECQRSRLGFPYLTEMLIEAHGNVNLAGSLGRTPLLAAFRI